MDNGHYVFLEQIDKIPLTQAVRRSILSEAFGPNQVSKVAHKGRGCLIKDSNQLGFLKGASNADFFRVTTKNGFSMVINGPEKLKSDYVIMESTGVKLVKISSLNFG